MDTTQLGIVGAGSFFLLIFLSGFWLSKSGKPFNAIILTIHKLLPLAAVALLAIVMYQVNQVTALSAIEWIAGLVTGLFFLGTGVTGGLLSIDKPMPTAVLRVHQITPFLIVLFTAVTLYLLST